MESRIANLDGAAFTYQTIAGGAERHILSTEAEGWSCTLPEVPAAMTTHQRRERRVEES